MIRFLVNFISKSLSFSKTEAQGTLVLLGILILVTGITKLEINRFYQNDGEISADTALISWVQEVEASYEMKKQEKKKRWVSKYPKPKAVAFTAYDKKNNTKPTRENTEAKETAVEKTLDPIKIRDINQATAEDLQIVKGIGPAYSKRIITYRDNLNGFFSNDQLGEVYGLEQSTIDELLKTFSILSPPRPFNFNNDSAKKLVQHPYINYDLAWILINYRQNHGDLLSQKDLKRIKALDDSTFNKLRHYLPE